MTSPRTRRRRLAALGAALLLLLLALLVAACGGGEDETARSGASVATTETEAGSTTAQPPTPPSRPPSRPPPPSEGVAIGIQDDQLADPNVDPVPRMESLDALNTRLIRVDMRWWEVAPTRPVNPRDPDDPAYDWAHNDRVVAAARERGIEVMFTIWGTPEWAADTSATVNEQFPFWGRRPASPQDYGDVAAAAAARYAPMGVRKWEAWNEPNNPLFLRPMYVRQGGEWVPEGPKTYAAMLNAFYDGVKQSDPGAIVAGGVTAPAGPASPEDCTTMPECRIMPIAFLGQVTTARPRPRMDLWSHHPYPLRRPSDESFAQAAYVDLYNLDRLQTAIDSTYLRGTPIWLTEFGFATEERPLYKFSVDEAEQARFLTDAVGRVRANPRIQIFIWYFLRDTVAWASGLEREDGTPKPAAEAFRQAAG